jgi:predicted dehydrogenase
MSRKMGIPLRVGVAGCGSIAQVIHIPILKKHPDVNLQALCDLDESKAAILADKFAIPHIYEDIDDMLNSEDLDVIFILTPNSLHLPMSLLALEYGVHLFIEKPVARNQPEVERIRKRAKKARKTVMVGMQNRFRSDVQALHKFIQANELGKLFFIKSGWLHAVHQSIKQPWLFQKNVSGGGVVMDLGVQMIDLIWWLLARPQPKSVKAFAYHINPGIVVEDFCVICINFAGDISISLEICWGFPITEDHFYLEIVGEKGIGNLNPLRLQKIMHGQIMNITPELRESKITNYKLGYQNEVNHFIDYLTGRVDRLESSLEDSIQIIRITDAIYQSITTNREVIFKS